MGIAPWTRHARDRRRRETIGGNHTRKDIFL